MDCSGEHHIKKLEKKLSKKNLSLKSNFCVDYKYIRGENGTQSLSFEIKKCVDCSGEHHIKK